jgi:hypothetical protein
VHAGGYGLHGGAGEVDPIKPTLKAPGDMRSKLNYFKLLSSFAFKSNVRRYSMLRELHSSADMFDGRSVHSSTFQLNVSTFWSTLWVVTMTIRLRLS